MRKRTSLLLLFLLPTLLGLGTIGRAAVVPATTYFPILPFGAAPDAEPQLLPVASSAPMDGDHRGTTRGIIIVHDASRDAQHALGMMMALAGSANSTTIILAPQFLLDSDIERFADHLPGKGNAFARWPLDGWITGDNSLSEKGTPNGNAGISSFAAIDLLLLYLSDKSSFPDMSEIIVAGDNAGADFVQRYAATGQAPDLLDQQNIPVRFAVANPSSYLYFTASRPKPGKGGLVSIDSKLCPDFNTWPYGLEGLNAYARRAGANAIKLRYVTRSITYLIGENAGQDDRLPDTSCAALLEGADRKARAQNFAAYLSVVFGDTAGKMQNFVTIPKIANDAAALYGSSCGMTTLFGDGMCGKQLFRPAETMQ